MYEFQWGSGSSALLTACSIVSLCQLKRVPNGELELPWGKKVNLKKEDRRRIWWLIAHQDTSSVVTFLQEVSAYYKFTVYSDVCTSIRIHIYVRILLCRRHHELRY